MIRRAIFLLAFIMTYTNMSSQTKPDMESNIFELNSTLFPIELIAKDHIRSVQCNVIQIASFGSFSTDTIGHYIANFDDSFRIIKENDQSDDRTIETTYRYDSTSVISFSKYSAKLNDYDHKITCIREVKERYSNGLKITSFSNSSSKVFGFASLFFVYDTFVYDSQNLLVGGYQLWINKIDEKDVDTLKKEYIYDKMGRIIEYRKFPLGNFYSPLMANQRCMTPFLENKAFRYEQFCDTTTIGVNSADIAPILVLSPTNEIILDKFNNHSFDIKIDLIPNEKKLEANKHRVLLFEYGESGFLPIKITAIYNQVILIYQFYYFK